MLEKGRYELGGDLSLDAAQQSRIISAALSAAVTSGNVAVGGAMTFNRIADTTLAHLRNAKVLADDLSIRTTQASLGEHLVAGLQPGRQWQQHRRGFGGGDQPG